MNYNPQIDDEILEQLLYRADAASAAFEDPDEADELLALFAEGRLQGEDRDVFLNYLDRHPQLRRAVVAYSQLKAADVPAVVPMPCQPETKTSSSPAGSWLTAAAGQAKRFTGKLFGRGWTGGESTGSSRSGAGSLALPSFFPRAAFAMAAMILFAAGTFIWFVAQPANGILNAFVLGFPNYGSDRGSENPSDIASELSKIDDAHVRMQLQEGFALVTSAAVSPEKVKLAHQHFQDVITSNPENYPENYYAWMGQGLTFFVMEENFNEAVAAFQQALAIDRNSTDAQINLALARTQLAKDDKAAIDDALAAWRAVDIRRLAEEDQKRVQQEIDGLEASRLDN